MTTYGAVKVKLWRFVFSHFTALNGYDYEGHYEWKDESSRDNIVSEVVLSPPGDSPIIFNQQPTDQTIKEGIC